MQVEVLLFAQLREALHTGRVRLSLDTGATVKDVTRVLSDRSGWQEVSSIPLLFAVNEEMVGEDHVLGGGDTVALLTPLSGG